MVQIPSDLDVLSDPPVLTLHQELKALLGWNPPKLTLGVDGSKSKATRKPSFYDKHLADGLILKHVKSLPTLLTAIANVVGTKLQDMRARRLPLPPHAGFPTLEHRELNLSTVMKNESTVSEFYMLNTAIHCMKVASTLGLHPGSRRWVPMLQWSSTPSTGCYAIADGSLQIREFSESVAPHIVAYERDAWEHIDDDIREIMPRMKELFPDLATWEIKSLSVGSEDVMQGIFRATLEPIFPWELCTNATTYGKRHSVIRDAVGPDATGSPWVINADSDSSGELTAAELSLVQEGFEEGSGSSQRQPSNLAANPSEDPFERDLSPMTSDDDDDDVLPPSATDPKGKGREYPSNPTRNPASAFTLNQTETNLGTPSKGRGRGRKRGEEQDTQQRKRKREDTDQNYTNVPELTAQRFLQQAWAQAVRNDTSLVVLHSGNYEYICVRHRKSQTFYVSDIINVETCKNPAYGELHVGLYIAAVQDTINRTKKIVEEEKQAYSQQSGHDGPQEPLDDNHDADRHDNDENDDTMRKRPKTNHRGNGHRNLKGRGQGSGQGQTRAKGHTDSTQIIQVASSRTLALVYLQYGIYDSPVPASFSRSKPSLSLCTVGPIPPPSPKSKKRHSANECITLLLTSEIGHGATGVVHGATLELITSDKLTLTHDVVVKLAFTDEQQDGLRDEYRIYQHLAQQSVKGVATVLGLFDDLEGCAAALVMTYAGLALDSRKGLLSSSERESFMTRLKEIHEAGVLHGDLRLQNLLIDENGQGTIIDFDQSQRTSSKSAMERERARLRELLDQKS